MRDWPNQYFDCYCIRKFSKEQWRKKLNKQDLITAKIDMNLMLRYYSFIHYFFRSMIKCSEKIFPIIQLVLVLLLLRVLMSLPFDRMRCLTFCWIFRNLHLLAIYPVELECKVHCSIHWISKVKLQNKNNEF